MNFSKKEFSIKFSGDLYEGLRYFLQVSLGQIEEKRFNFDRAVAQYKKALTSLSKTTFNSYAYYDVAEKIVNIYLQNGQFEKAIEQNSELITVLEHCCDGQFVRRDENLMINYVRSLLKLSKCYILSGLYQNASIVLANAQSFLLPCQGNDQLSGPCDFKSSVDKLQNVVHELSNRETSDSKSSSLDLKAKCLTFPDKNIVPCLMASAERFESFGIYTAAYFNYKFVNEYIGKEDGDDFPNYFVPQSLQGMGRTSLNLGEPEKSLDFMLRACAIFEKLTLTDTKHLELCEKELASSWVSVGNCRKARKLLLKYFSSLEMTRRLEDCHENSCPKNFESADPFNPFEFDPKCLAR